MSGTNIPELVPAGLKDLVFLETCARAAYALYVERIGREPAPMVADFQKDIEDGKASLILLDGKKVGYVIIFSKNDALFIENVALHPDAQGKRLARPIFEELENRARAAQLVKLSLYTNEKMTENLSLYPKLGFVETDRRTENGFNRVYFEKSV